MAKLFDKVSGDFLNSIKSVMEKTLTSAEMKKREEVAKAIERDNPSMPMSKKMAVATSTAKKVAEAKLDPVNHKELEGTHAQRKDKDINNDGKVDGTDKYLHTRRKAVKHAIAKKMKEEAEQIDEISADMKSRYKQKAQRSLDQAQDFKSELDYEGEPKGSRVRKDVNRIIKNRKTGMKRANEEAEQIDELSTDTMKRYQDKARTSADALRDKGFRGNAPAWKKAQNRSDSIDRAQSKIKARSTNEEAEQIDEISTKLATDYSAKAADARGHRKLSTAKLDKRYKSMALAHEKIRARHAKVPTTEETEQIDELSKKTLGSYVKKAAHQAASRGTSGGMSIARGNAEDEAAGIKAVNKAYKRTQGISKAVNRLTKEEIALTPEEIEMIEAKMAGVADGALPGDEHMCATKVFHKEWNEGVPVPTMHADPDEDGLIEWYDVMFDHGIERVMTEDMEVLQAESHMHSKKKMKEDVDEVVEEAPKGYGGRSVTGSRAGYWKRMRQIEKDYGDKSPVKKKMKEEAEDLDESAKVAAHLIKRYGDNVRKSHVRSAANDFGVGYVALSHAVRKKLGVQKLGEEQMDEARGRPKKAAAKDFTVHPVTKEKMMHNNPEHMKRIERLQKNGVLEKPKVEAGQHIMNQLSKAKTSMRGGETINFTHGESKHVSGSHAAKLITKYQGMKPSEKEDFQKKIGHSHEQLMKHV